LARRTRILLALVTLVGLCAALAAFLVTHRRHANETPTPEDAPPPPVFDIKRGEEAHRTALRFQQLLSLLDEDFERGLPELRAFMDENAGTGWEGEGHLQLAIRYGRTGDVAKAMGELDALAALPDQGRRATRGLLLRAELLGRSDEAAAGKILDQVRGTALDRDLKMRAAYLLGAAALEKGRFEEAVAQFKDVVGVTVPETPKARAGVEKAVLGRMAALADAGEWAAAIRWADKMIEDFPDLAILGHTLRYRQATAHRHLGAFARARIVCERLRRDVGDAVLGDDIDLDAELAAIGLAEQEAGIRRTRAAFMAAKEAGQETREHVEGEIAADATWAKSPIVLAGPVVVKTGATLTIEPGTAVQFLTGAKLTVEGGLVARGTAEQPIRFTSAVPKAPTFFDGEGVELLEASAGGRRVLEHCVLEYQRIGLACRGAQPVLRDCTFARNGVVGLLVADIAELAVEGCAFEANDGMGIEVRTGRASVAVRRCRILRNGGDGLSVTSTGGAIEAAIEGNRIESNGGNGIACDLDVAAEIAGNLIAGNHGDGIYLNRSSGRTIAGNRLERNQGAGIHCERDSSPEIVGNLILGSGGSGISLSGSRGAIRDNTILGSRSNSIFLAERASPAIEGNWLIGTGGAHMQIGEASAPTIRGNVFAGWDVGTIGTLGRLRIQAQGNFFGPKDTGRRLQGDPLAALDSLTLAPLAEEQIEDTLFHKKDHAQLGEIVWKPCLTELPKRPPVPELTGLP